MKGSFKLQARRKLTPAEAKACMAANLVLPGSGSLAAGRRVGYAQMAATLLATIFTAVSAVPMFKWVMAGGGFGAQSDDPFQALADLWSHACWPLASIGVFIATIVWSVATGYSILREASRPDVPPIIR